MNIKIGFSKGILLFSLCIFLILILLVDVSVLLQNIKIMIPEYILNNLKLFKKIIIPFISVIVVVFCIISFIKNKYSIKVEQLSFGGIKILFDRREILFTNSVQNFFYTKFCIAI